MTLGGSSGEYNLAVSCFTRTMSRELEVVDFTWSVFKAGTCLLQPRRVSDINLVAAFFSHENVAIFSSLFLAIFVFANLIWVAEHGDNPEFQGDGTYGDGIWHGIWFTVVTFTTVGYGEKTPITKLGKVFVMTWMFVGLGFACLITGTLAAYLTTSAAKPNQYSWEDLQANNQLRVATVMGSSLEEMLANKGIKTHVTYADEQASYQPLMRGDFDVMVADWPVVLADMRRGLISSSKYVCHGTTNDDSYGLAFPNNGNLNHEILVAMTKVNSGLITWEKSSEKVDAFEKYFVVNEAAGVGGIRSTRFTRQLFSSLSSQPPKVERTVQRARARLEARLMRPLKWSE